MAARPSRASELIDVRPDERLDLRRLEPWLRAHLPAARGALTIGQFGGGHANLTYLLRIGDREYVLRRPPLGPVAPTAHDMRREHRVLSRLGARYPVFGVFKLAVVLQQIHVRFQRGQTCDARFAALGERVERLAAKGLALLQDVAAALCWSCRPSTNR